MRTHGQLWVDWFKQKKAWIFNPEYSLEGLMLKLKLQYFGLLMRRVNSMEKTLMLGKIEGKRRRGWQRMRWFDYITNMMNMNLRKLQEIIQDRETRYITVYGVTNSQRWLSNWTTNNSRKACLSAMLWFLVENSVLNTTNAYLYTYILTYLYM